MSPSTRPTTRPSLGEVAELLHRGTAEVGGSVVLSIRDDVEAETVAFGFWTVPPTVAHPADPLIGFLAPRGWDAIGLATTGLLHDLAIIDGAAAGPPQPIRATVLRDRSGAVASVLDRRDGEVQVLEGAPQGWVADALARALGHATPPPADPLSHLVEATWLDHIAGVVLTRPGACRSWEALARLHPLAPPGAALPGALLAVQSQALDLESSWRRMRLRFAGYPGATPGGHRDPAVRPPDGLPIRPEHWFDDGSFCRWSQRNLPPGTALLEAVLDALPDTLGRQLLDALTSIPTGDLDPEREPG